MPLAVLGSVSLSHTNRCTSEKEDAILIEGTADRCVSLRISHRGGKVLNTGRAQFGGTKCHFGVCGQKGLLMSGR